MDRVAEDPAADPELVAGVQRTLEDIVRSYALLLGMEKVCEGILGQFEKAQKGIQRYQWMKVYEDLNTFRTSMPSEMVCDFAEKDVDLRLPVFECGHHLIAFDGAALLLNELWQRLPGR